jgi:predicted dithiol-disulfide oxidoreductase (DUF899 family)
MGTTHAFRFSSESPEYRHARDRLLQAELDLVKQVDAVARMRQRLPLGGAAPDYVFEEGAADLNDRDTVRAVRLSQLFEPGKDTLVVYSFMYGPDMPEACPMCTSFIDGLNGNGGHIRQRVNLVIVAKSPIERMRSFARERGWYGLRLVSSAKNTYNRDYYGELPDGDQITMMNVFGRRNGTIYHFWGSEVRFIPAGDRDPRHIDLMWSLWNVLDLTPEGRGKDWYPALSYE